MSPESAKESAILGTGVFTERLLVPRRCTHALVEVIKQMSIGALTPLEIDTVISRILHVFQSKDTYLKLFCFAFIRAVAESSSGAFIAVNALLRMLTKRTEIKADALRLLLQITPAAMLDDCAKYVQQALIETEYSTLDAIIPVLAYAPSHTLSAWFTELLWAKHLTHSGAFGNALIMLTRAAPEKQNELISLCTGKYLRGYSSVVALRKCLIPGYIAVRDSRISTNSITDQINKCVRLEETDEATFIEALRGLIKSPPQEQTLTYLENALKGVKSLLLCSSFIFRVATLRTLALLVNSPYKRLLSGLRPEIQQLLGQGGSLGLFALQVLLGINTQEAQLDLIKTLPELLPGLPELDRVSALKALTASDGPLFATAAAVGESGTAWKILSPAWSSTLSAALNGTGSPKYKAGVVKVLGGVLNRAPKSELTLAAETALCTYLEDSPWPRVSAEALGVLIGRSVKGFPGCLVGRLLLEREPLQGPIRLALAALGDPNEYAQLGCPSTPGDQKNTAGSPILNSVPKGGAHKNWLNQGGRVSLEQTLSEHLLSEDEDSTANLANPTRYLFKCARETLSPEDLSVFASAPGRQVAAPLTEIEQKEGTRLLNSSPKHPLTRPRSEFSISLCRHLFPNCVLLEYTLESQLDSVLEEGSLCVYLEQLTTGTPSNNNNPSNPTNSLCASERIHLPPRGAHTLTVRVPYTEYKEVLGAQIRSTFSYVVREGRDYEEGEVRLSPIWICPGDFVGEHSIALNALSSTTPLSITAEREISLNMSRGEALKEARAHLGLPVVEERRKGFLCRGVFLLTQDPIEVEVSATPQGEEAVSLMVTVRCGNKEFAEALVQGIGAY